MAMDLKTMQSLAQRGRMGRRDFIQLALAAGVTVTAAESRSIYGPLAAPIAVLLWLYLLALAVLIGAAVNAAFDTVFPQKNTTRARLELVQRLRDRITVRDS